MTLQFYKYQGTGNDFILLDNRKGEISLTVEQVAFLCHPKFGIGADGLMLLQNYPGYDFEMVYYNSDGKPSSMCGNGGRCITRFAFDLGIIKLGAQFIAADGPHISSINGERVKLKMKDVDGVKMIGDDMFIDTGSPHYIRKVEKAEAAEVFSEGKRIRYSEQFSPGGTNVNFLEINPGGLKGRTYERGVENETLSCGTGVTAMVIAAHHSGMKNMHTISTPGGDLEVNFSFDPSTGKYHDIWLCGPAKYVFKGEITL